MARCGSVYYGQDKDYPCKHEAGHDGWHSADTRIGTKEELNYVTWDDEDAAWSLNYKFTKLLGGK